jgi:hypothetical protein
MWKHSLSDFPAFASMVELPGMVSRAHPFFVAFMALFAWMVACQPASAGTNYAVLVAVTTYPNLPERTWLVGPNNDAELVRQYLTEHAPVKFDPANVAILADGIDGGVTPTHAAILEKLAEIAAKVTEGDFVYLHFSGHGSQQPQGTPEGSETDGLDEIFLPADTQPWKDRSTAVGNALVDDEIGKALDGIREAGAFVWFVIDACNSGTATRAAPVGEDQIEERKLDPTTDLGIPVAEMAAPSEGTRGFESLREGALDAKATGARKRGGLVAFYAAQTIETTPEMPLPKGSDQARKFGLFTFTLFSKLAENPNVTYRQLGHAILQQYVADVRSRPTPLFEGDLDARVFGSEQLDTVMQWPVTVGASKISIQAGLLHRIVPGTRLAILPSPVSELKETLGYVQVTSAKNLDSSLMPVAFDDKPALPLASIPQGAYVRLSELAVDFQLKVARPAPAPGLEADVVSANAALDRVVVEAKTLFNIALVDAGASADVRLAVLRETDVPNAPMGTVDTPALWFLPPSGELAVANGSRPPLVSMSNPERFEKGLVDNLQKIYRATALSRVAAASDYKPEDVSVAFQIKRKATGALEPLDGATVPIVRPGDQMHIVAENLSRKIVDVNILYVGNDYSITHMGAQRLVAGAKLNEGLLEFTDSSFGMERMIVVLTEAPPLSEVEDLRYLEQGGVPPATRSVGQGTAFSDMLAAVGGGTATRSAMKLGEQAGPKGGVFVYPIELVPGTP